MTIEVFSYICVLRPGNAAKDRSPSPQSPRAPGEWTEWLKVKKPREPQSSRSRGAKEMRNRKETERDILYHFISFHIIILTACHKIIELNG